MNSGTDKGTPCWTCPYCGKEQAAKDEWKCQYCDMAYHVKHNPRRIRVRSPKNPPKDARAVKKTVIAYLLASLVGIGFAFLWGYTAYITEYISTMISIPTGILVAVILYLPVRKVMRCGYFAIGVSTVGSALLGEYICILLISVYKYHVPYGVGAFWYAFDNFFYVFESSAYFSAILFGCVGMICGCLIYWRIGNYRKYPGVFSAFFRRQD